MCLDEAPDAAETETTDAVDHPVQGTAGAGAEAMVGAEALMKIDTRA